MKINLQEIREITEKLDFKQWKFDERIGGVAVYKGDENDKFNHQEVKRRHIDTAKFIATCNPQTVLQLLDHIDKLTAAAWEAVNDHDLRCEDSNSTLHRLEEVLKEAQHHED